MRRPGRLSVIFVILTFILNLFFSPAAFGFKSGMICAKDLNGDGEIQENEYASCDEYYTCPDPNGSECDENHQCVVTSEPDCPLGDYPCKNGTCTKIGVCQSKQIPYTKYVCPVDNKVYDQQNTCNNNCIEVGVCERQCINCVSGTQTSEVVQKRRRRAKDRWKLQVLNGRYIRYCEDLVSSSSKCGEWIDLFGGWGKSVVLRKRKRRAKAGVGIEYDGAGHLRAICRTSLIWYSGPWVSIYGSGSSSKNCDINFGFEIKNGKIRILVSSKRGSWIDLPHFGYKCSLNGSTYSSLSSCQSSCRRGKTCITHIDHITKWKCSLNKKLYDTKDQCTSSCYESARCNCPSGYSYSDDDICKEVLSCDRNWRCPFPGGSECVDIDMNDTYENDAKFEDGEGEFKYYDDNAWGDDGSCEGQIIFFNGQPQECLTAGIKTGFHNCCNECKSEIKNDLENAMSMYRGLKVVSGIWKTVTVAYRAAKAYSYLSSLGEAASFIDSASLASQFKLSESAATAVMHAGSMEGAMQGAIQATYFSAPAIWTTVGWFAASLILEQGLKIFFGGCNATSVLTACYKEMGLCHYVGKRCVKKWPAVGCVQRSKVYCCYNSKLARIINEAARQQLETLQGWGSAKFPVCRGLYPEEFQMLDFSKIDLSEWYEDIKTRAMENIQQKMEENVEKFKQEYQQPGTD